MIKNLSIMHLIVLLLITTSCAPEIIYKLESLEYKDYYKGREIVNKENDSAVVSVEIDSYNEKEVVFYIQIENKSNNNLFIEPKDFYIDGVLHDLRSIDERFPRYYALDPEREIKRIDKEMEGRKTAHDVVTGVNAIVALVSIIADLADSDRRNKAHRIVDNVFSLGGKSN